MSIVNVNHGSRELAPRFAGLFGGISRRFTQYRTYRTTLDELEALSDRELADLGIARTMLRSVAYQAAYGS